MWVLLIDIQGSVSLREVDLSAVLEAVKIDNIHACPTVFGSKVISLFSHPKSTPYIAEVLQKSHKQKITGSALLVRCAVPNGNMEPREFFDTFRRFIDHDHESLRQFYKDYQRWKTPDTWGELSHLKNEE